MILGNRDTKKLRLNHRLFVGVVMVGLTGMCAIAPATSAFAFAGNHEWHDDSDLSVTADVGINANVNLGGDAGFNGDEQGWHQSEAWDTTETSSSTEVTTVSTTTTSSSSASADDGQASATVNASSQTTASTGNSGGTNVSAVNDSDHYSGHHHSSFNDELAVGLNDGLGIGFTGHSGVLLDIL